MGESATGDGHAADFQCDNQSACGLGQGHFLQLFITEIFKKALNDREQFLGGDPLLFT